MQSATNPSPLPNSLLTGKLTGNFVKFARWARFRTLTREQIQKLAVKFPTQPNREFFRKSREFESKNREFEPSCSADRVRMMFFGMERAVSWPAPLAPSTSLRRVFEPEDQWATTAGWNATAQHQFVRNRDRESTFLTGGC
jgi:hypothetical protein